MKLHGKTALVTGAGSGIGEAIARRLAEEGAYVVIGDIEEVEGRRVAAFINDGRESAAEYISVDVTKEADMKQVVERAAGKFGTLDILVNNAGVGTAGTVLEQTEQEWDLMMSVNAKGAFFGCKYGVAQMLKQETGGSIVNIASVAGMVGVLNRAGYCASKAAIVGLTKSVASDFADKKIRVNSISPGTVDSPWIQKILSGQEDPDGALNQMQMRQPIGRMGTPEEIANVVLFLASEESSFVTGSNFVADGGLTAR